MNTRKLTEAAMLSALFVIVSIVAISTGIMYTVYLDMIVPIFICILYLRIGKKYTILSSITSLFIVAFAIGDVPSSIWMSQGILLGLICGYVITKKSEVLDDILLASILGCFIVILVDVYFSTLTGYSLIKEFNTTIAMFPIGEEMVNAMFYIFVATVPVGTVLVVYIGTLFLGHKLRILNDVCKEKYSIISNFKKLGSYLCCSKMSFILSVIYLGIVELLNIINVNISWTYLLTVIMSVRVVVLYFIIKDSLGFISKYIYLKSKSRAITQVATFVILYSLLLNFSITIVLLIVGNIVINMVLKLREKEINMINRFVNQI